MRLQRIYLNAWGRVVKPGKGRLRERYARCCTDVVVTLNSTGDKKFRLFRPLEEYRQAFEHFRALGVRVHVMSWVRPDVEFIEAMAAGLAELHAVAPFETVLLDAEGSWSRGWPKDGRPPKRYHREQQWEMCAALVATLIPRVVGVPWGATDVPMVSWGVFGPLAIRADYVMPQAHEFGMRSGIRKPGRLVAWTHRAWPKRLGGVPLIPHLAAYGRTQTAAGLRASVESAVGLGYTSFGAWTGRSLGGRSLRAVLAEYKREIQQTPENIA